MHEKDHTFMLQFKIVFIQPNFGKSTNSCNAGFWGGIKSKKTVGKYQYSLVTRYDGLMPKIVCYLLPYSHFFHQKYPKNKIWYTIQCFEPCRNKYFDEN